MTASVLVSKKWIRSGTKAMRIFSCGRALTDGSTRQTTDCPPTLTLSRISEPSGSTTSTTASKARSDESAADPTRRSSGRMPRVSGWPLRSEEHTSELQSPCNLVCRLLLEKKKKKKKKNNTQKKKIKKPHPTH